MSKKTKFSIFLVFVLIIFNGALSLAVADDDHKEKRWYQKIFNHDDDSRNVIADYLKSNSAEYSSAKRAVKIMRSLRDPVPLRITDIPYIIEKHHEISPNVLKIESIGSLSNCSACHTTAKNGIYEDDNVKIPK